ncbi:CopL family metal-binding regulatory protein [Sinimarinibacterium sp. CAU 1509]|uniref:CopL family metal-binding regulatory protein n=1 Tax=Sinimarinibacterium sp. CAU 1509 TaxID=2562283 RepID=UPI0010ACAD3F|nr:CopL family metal-binding regulatory protein [Sinimarinibacterium sp. CAU 1509]TJY64871.1 CopL family metal-binding regulatory protein [Sinimarinibacterium sp. CAU 1509]
MRVISTLLLLLTLLTQGQAVAWATPQVLATKCAGHAHQTHAITMTSASSAMPCHHHQLSHQAAPATKTVSMPCCGKTQKCHCDAGCIAGVALPVTLARLGVPAGEHATPDVLDTGLLPAFARALIRPPSPRLL